MSNQKSSSQIIQENVSQRQLKDNAANDKLVLWLLVAHYLLYFLLCLWSTERISRVRSLH